MTDTSETPATEDTPVQARHTRLLTNPDGIVAFLVIADDDPSYFAADVYTVGYNRTLDEAVGMLTGEDAEWAWVGDLGTEPYGTFYVKWDSCSHYLSGATGAERSDTSRSLVGGTLHLCGHEDWVQHLALLEHVYTMAMAHIAETPGGAELDRIVPGRQALRSAMSDMLTLADVQVPFPPRRRVS